MNDMADKIEISTSVIRTAPIVLPDDIHHSICKAWGLIHFLIEQYVAV